MNIDNIQVYLASQSPRRKELLSQMGVNYKILLVDIDEKVMPDENGYDYVNRLALEKAQAGCEQVKKEFVPVLGSDTCIVFKGEIIGKPQDELHATKILQTLSGNVHQVISAVAICNASRCNSKVQASKVFFKTLNADEIKTYVKTGEPLDKAGAYAIQGLAAKFIRHIEGSYSGVMGLPLYETAELLNEFKICI